jgi:uncharacterized protein YukE
MGDRVTCGRCAALQAENKRLRARVQQLEQRIQRILRAVRDAAAAARGIDAEAAKRMAGGNTPRAAWSYLKASRETARALGRKISQAMLQ